MNSTSRRQPPTVFHITHWKAGSQWVRAVLTEAQPDRVVAQKSYVAHVLQDVIRPGGIYPCVYLPFGEFELLPIPRHSKRFVVIRDLRDTLISWYFSMKTSHPLNDRVRPFRQALSRLDLTDGLIYLMDTRLKEAANIQMSWISRGDPVVRYEDLLLDPEDQFARIFSHCLIDIAPASASEVVAAHAFEKLAGRSRGDEDVSSYYRKGIAGDWGNFFTERLKREFKRRFDEILLSTGYVHNSDW